MASNNTLFAYMYVTMATATYFIMDMNKKCKATLNMGANYVYDYLILVI